MRAAELGRRAGRRRGPKAGSPSGKAGLDDEVDPEPAEQRLGAFFHAGDDHELPQGTIKLPAGEPRLSVEGEHVVQPGVGLDLDDIRDAVGDDEVTLYLALRDPVNLARRVREH